MSETIPERLEKMSRDYRGKVAISFRGTRILYRDLPGIIAQEVAAMQQAGIQPGTRVVTAIGNSWHALRFYLAALTLGVIPIPLSPRTPEDMQVNILRAASAQFLLREAPLKDQDVPCAILRENGEISYPLTLLPSSIPLPELESPVAALFCTSGTTGMPKLVMLTHRNILSDIDSCFDLVDISPEDRMLGVLPMFHVFGFSIAYLLPLMKGMTLTIVPSLYPLEEFIAALREDQSTVFLGVPAIFSILTGARKKTSFDLHPLRLLICGGDALPSRVREAFEEAFGLCIIEGYGITEASPVVAVNPSPEVRVPGSAGPVISAIRLRIVNDTGEDLGTNEVGEILLAGDPVSPGYFANPEENAQAFREGWFCTGDLGRIDERGILYIEGRKKEVIIVSGFNVYPQEVEEVLLGFPGVAQAAVVGVKRELRGEMVKAYIVPQEGVSLKPREIVDFCRKHLPPHKVPRLVEIVPGLPQTATGKVMKYLLAKAASEKEYEV
uniref:Long-chain fatty acid--CoA ligase n=1 Tax=Candidatus Caldatribacterium californiense TaxID=1454726 RepID=A0A7V3YKC1_9BACT